MAAAPPLADDSILVISSMTRTYWRFAALLLLPACLWAQQPAAQQHAASPAAASALPPMAAPPTGPAPNNPNAATFIGGGANGAAPLLPPALQPNPHALRVYVETPNGPDAQQIAGLMQQYLFESHQVVVTENESNASVILKGIVYRQPKPAQLKRDAARRRREERALAAARRREERAIAQGAQPSAGGGTQGGASYINPTQIPSVGTASSGSAGAGSYGGGSAAFFGSGDGESSLPSMDSLLNPGLTDLHNYRYRLDLELVNPDGDLVWISGRGAQAPNFTSANQAVSQSLQPMLDLLHQVTHPGKKASANTPAS
jgi:hypothetical protein